MGIGTGPILLSVDGDIGLGTQFGPLEAELSLSASDISDLTDSAIGFGGYATDGKWMVQYKLGKLKLEGLADKALKSGAVVSSKVNFDITEGEMTVGYSVYQNSSVTLRGYGGLRYLKHEFEANIYSTAAISGLPLNKTISESWVDGLIGVSADVPFAPKWNWNIKGNAGYGGSEGTYLAATSVNWQFYGNWSSALSLQYKAVDYENGTKRENDWYLYDVDETTAGLSILYNW
jgi:hypothetical protein